MESMAKLAGITLGVIAGGTAASYGLKKYTRKKTLKKFGADDLTTATGVLNRLKIDITQTVKKKAVRSKWSLPVSELSIADIKSDLPGVGVIISYTTIGMSNLTKVELLPIEDQSRSFEVKHLDPENQTVNLMVVKTILDEILKSEGLMCVIFPNEEEDEGNVISIVESK